jgi:hypothetical protein
MMIVEDGVGTPGANSYVSLNYANTYFSMYLNEAWDGEDSEKETSLIMATQSVDLLYGDLFLSWRKVDSLGPLLFPRIFFYDNNYQIVQMNQIPECLMRAVCEIACLYLQGINIFPEGNTDNNVNDSMLKVGDIEISNKYVRTKGDVERYANFRKIDLILKPILKPKSVKVTLSR